MASKPTSKQDDPAQSARFIEAVKAVAADVSAPAANRTLEKFLTRQKAKPSGRDGQN